MKKRKIGIRLVFLRVQNRNKLQVLEILSHNINMTVWLAMLACPSLSEQLLDGLKRNGADIFILKPNVFGSSLNFPVKKYNHVTT